MESETNCMVQDQVSMEDVAKQPVALPIRLGQAHTNVLEHCHVATANSCCAKTQNTDNKTFNRTSCLSDAQTATFPRNRHRSSAYSICMQLPLAEMREELTWYHPIMQPVFSSVFQRHYVLSPHF